MNVKEFFKNFWRKYKKNIIACIIVALLCAGSFTCGRCIRLRRAEQSGSRVEQSVSGAELSASEIADATNTVGSLLGSIESNDDTAIRELAKATGDVAELQSIIDECRATFEASQRELENSISRIDTAIDATDYILAIAELKTKQDERTLSKLAELLGYSDEMPGEQ